MTSKGQRKKSFFKSLKRWYKKTRYFILIKFDKNKYAKNKGNLLEYEICNTQTIMFDKDNGYDIKYRENMLDNLKIASRTVDHLYIYPGETFSLHLMLRDTKKHAPLKEGLALLDGKIVPRKGGGLCQLSSLLYKLFLMSPLTIVERHGYKVKYIPNYDESLIGVDADIYNGALDLKIKNNTDNTYQIVINFDDTRMYGRLLSDKPDNNSYEITNKNLKYIKREGKIYEEVTVEKSITNKKTNKIVKVEKLYDEISEIAYKLPSYIKVEEPKTAKKK